ncbi:MFS transporter [Nicoliella lavandulae]|uniref:MFS transporter n=1 Tax=Nicoliella lavandulae TaxID=3082954 RepID=A0ABU8SLP9_9LACO
MKDNRKFGIILPIILVSYFIILLDNSVVFTSTVSIANELNMNAHMIAWITNMYALMFGSLLLLGGRLGDLYGRKRIFLIGLIIFSIGSLMVGIAPSGGFLIGMRALQGVGSAILAPTSLALLLDNYTGQQRSQAIAYYGVTAGLGASVGLIVGGLITTFYSWRLGFLINVPIGVALIIMTIMFIPSRAPKSKQQLDYLGSFLSVIGFLALVYSIDGSIYKLPALIVAIIFLGAFILREAKTNHPVMPLKLFTDSERLSAYVARFFYIGVMISYFFLVPQVLQKYYGFTPLMAAVGFMPETIPQFIFGYVQSKAAQHFKNSTILVFGTFVTLIGVALAFIIGLKAGYWMGVALPMVVIGIGQGFSFGPLTASGVANTSDDIAGAASSAVNVFHQIGSSVVLSSVIALTANFHPVLNATIIKRLL